MKKVVFAVFAVSLVSCLALMLNGCETTSAADRPEITPSAATVKINQPVEFRASGGFEYTWSLQDETLGRLDTRRGPKVVYRSMFDPGTSNAAVQILTVSSTIEGSSGSTNAESFVQTGEAIITHIPAD